MKLFITTFALTWVVCCAFILLAGVLGWAIGLVI